MFNSSSDSIHYLFCWSLMYVSFCMSSIAVSPPVGNDLSTKHCFISFELFKRVTVKKIFLIFRRENVENPLISKRLLTFIGASTSVSCLCLV